MSSKNDEKETKGIKVMFILEMIGRPPEHLTETMEKIIKQMDEEKGTKVLSKDIKEPIELKDNKEFFSTFAEIELEVEEIANLAILLFKYMPSHVEIIQPELIALTNGGWNDILNELTRRLHGYDEVARVMQYQNAELQKKLKELMPNENGDGENKTERKPEEEELKVSEIKTEKKVRKKKKII